MSWLDQPAGNWAFTEEAKDTTRRVAARQTVVLHMMFLLQRRDLHCRSVPEEAPPALLKSCKTLQVDKESSAEMTTLYGSNSPAT
jgi:hypothetical protein